MSGYLQASLNHMLQLRHTTNLSVSDLELLFPHGQLTIVLAEDIRAQDAVRVLPICTNDDFLLIRVSCYSFLDCGHA